MRTSDERNRTDAAVIDRSTERPDAFAILFDRHAPAIHRYLARRVDRGTADDLVADVFLIAFAKRGGYDTTRTNARPWLYGIATNLLGQHRRGEIKRYRLPARADPAGALHAGDMANRLIGDVTARSMRAELADALSALRRATATCSCWWRVRISPTKRWRSHPGSRWERALAPARTRTSA